MPGERSPELKKSNLSASSYQQWDYKKNFYINATVTDKEQIEVMLEEKRYIQRITNGKKKKS